jgi:hypothetical protein
METNLPLRTPVAAHTAKAKPDARPMRMALGAGGLAALSALATAIVLPPRTTTQAAAVLVQQPTDTASAMDMPSGTPLASDRPVRYVQLLPGQTAPPGASVIPAPTPSSATMVVTVPAPGQKQTTKNPPAQNPPAQNPPAQQATPAPPPPAQATPAPPPPPKPPPVIVKTTQSGKVVP